MASSILYRLGRKLYTYARQEIGVNSIATNGESALQKQIISLYANEPIIFFDVGANVGEWTLNALQQTITDPLTIHAFEPVHKTHEVLTNNIQPYLNNNLAVHTNRLALSNEGGELLIHLSGNLAGSNSLHATPEATETEVIHLITLDEYCVENNIDYIHLVKIDTEGHDMFAIEGAVMMLSSEKIAVIQFEYNHRWIFSRRYLKDVFDFVNTHQLAYKLGKVIEGGILLYSSWHYELEKYFEGNYVLLHNSLVEKLPCKQVQFDQYNAVV